MRNQDAAQTQEDREGWVEKELEAVEMVEGVITMAPWKNNSSILFSSTACCSNLKMFKDLQKSLDWFWVTMIDMEHTNLVGISEQIDPS